MQSQALLDKAADIDSEGSEDFEEPPDQRAILHVLSTLPGISATDSRSYRIEALRVHLENQLGDQAFIEAYRHLVVSYQYNRKRNHDINNTYFLL